MFTFFRRGAPAQAPTGPRVAAIDIGSNSFHLLVVEAEPDWRLAILEHTKEMVRFGESTLRDGAIPPDAFARGVATLQNFVQMALVHQPEEILAVATSSVREASNGPMFVRAVADATGLQVRVIDSVEEARLIYCG